MIDFSERLDTPESRLSADFHDVVAEVTASRQEMSSGVIDLRDYLPVKDYPKEAVRQMMQIIDRSFQDSGELTSSAQAEIQRITAAAFA